MDYCGLVVIFRLNYPKDYNEYIAGVFQMPIIGRFGESRRNLGSGNLPLIAQSV